MRLTRLNSNFCVQLVRLLPLVFAFMVQSSFGVAQNKSGIRGKITSSDGEIMAFATIYVKQTESGTTANENGLYEIDAEPGWYNLTFRFLGHETVTRTIEIKDGYVELNVELKPQATLLQEMVVGGSNEDPAYTIMRKAIAKANYHRQQVDFYSARVYIKGAGKLIDYPWLAKSQLKKAGVEKGRVYVSESVSEVKYTRPKKFEEKVISIRSDGKDNNTSPNGYIFGTFYEPEIAETISPLSPKAFSYYKFEYLGTFTDLNYAISKIKVIPRSRGDNVVEGMIYLVEDVWAIHSVDVKTTRLGITFGIKSNYQPIEDKAWLPVTHQFQAKGKVFGFEFEYNYLATVSNYKIKLNPNLVLPDMEVVDEKVDKKHAKEIEKQHAAAKPDKNADAAKKLQERIASGKEITRKELKTLVKEYEKEDRKAQKEPEVISEVDFKVDSGAFKKDTAYWESVRPIPLTVDEVKGYKVADSISVVERKKEEGDTVKQSKHKGFQLYDILTGDSYKIKKHSTFQINTPMGGFNTVDGFHVNYRLTFGTIFQDTNKTRFTISPLVRYAFSRKQYSGILDMTLRNKNYRLRVEGGKYVKQFNQDEPILPIVNTFMTLLLEQNYMKLYEREFIDVNYRRKINPFLSVQTDWSWSQRHQLVNHTNYKWIDRREIEGYTSNTPTNRELASTDFQTHQALIGTLRITAKPWLKFSIRNGHKHEIGNSTPSFTLEYKKGFNTAFGSDVDYDQIEFGIRHQFDIGVRGRLDYKVLAGSFLNTRKMFFMDYNHFLGNQTPFVTTDPVGSFRLLRYYDYSTNNSYFAGSIHYHFRRFLVTSFPLARMTGIRENIFANYLATPTSRNYTELGYSIDGILRLFRVEAIAAFQDGIFTTYGFRVGISTTLSINFSDNN